MSQNNQNIQMVILDLDGVITSTATLHAQAWKEMFDTFLQQYSKDTDTAFVPFDPQKEYRQYVDGRPRYEGAKKFLYSRKIEIPWGAPTDEPSQKTVCGLGNRKNQLYLALLRDKGAHVFPDTLQMIKLWRKQNLKVGVISASKNCREVLSGAGIIDLFDIIVDGVDSEKYGLKGKPQPDIFLFAAKKMGVNPSHAVIIEDSSAGIQAGTDAYFAHRIGVARNGNSQLLSNHGADIVVSKLTEIHGFNGGAPRPFAQIPSALDQFDKVLSELLRDNPLLLFDYDGTLTPIVSRPEMALLSPEMGHAVHELSQRVKVAIVSGRDLADVKNLVGMANLYYAGSHGFEIDGPEDTKMELESALRELPVLDNAEQSLRKSLEGIEGILVERKKYAVTVHFRLVETDLIVNIQKIMQNTASRFEQLKLTEGKMVLELRPAIDWDKGKAILWIAHKLFAGKETSPLYMGDDITDEDAFRELAGWGTGILVGDHKKESFADYKLDNTGQVLVFLNKLKGNLKV